MSDILARRKKEGPIQSQCDQTEKEGKEGGRAEGINAKRPAETKKGGKDAQGLHQFLSARNKKHCFGEWQLVSSDTRRV